MLRSSAAAMLLVTAASALWTTPTAYGSTIPWATSPPVIDGNATHQEWGYALQYSIPNGKMFLLSDDRYLYLLTDLTGFTADGDRFIFNVYFDVDLNKQVTNLVDMKYHAFSGYPGPGAGMQRMFNEPRWGQVLGASTGMQATAASQRNEFTSSFNSGAAHHLVEFRIPLNEIQSAPGRYVNLGIWYYFVDVFSSKVFPSGWLTSIGAYNKVDFRKMLYVRLASVPPQPIADFQPVPVAPTINQPVRFVNRSSNASDYEWDFGDGYHSNEYAPVHQYGSSGTYSVKLTSCQGTNCRSKTSKIEVIRNVAIISGNVLLNGEPVPYDGSVCITPAWGDFLFQLRNRKCGRFEEEIGAWNINDVAFGNYMMLTKSDEEHCCGCSVGVNIPRHELDTTPITINTKSHNFLVDVACEFVINPFDDLPPGVARCVTSLAAFVPGVGAFAAAAALFEASLAYDNHLERGEYCQAGYRAIDVAYSSQNLILEVYTGGTDLLEDAIGAFYSCLLSPLAESLDCDLNLFKAETTGPPALFGGTEVHQHFVGFSKPGGDVSFSLTSQIGDSAQWTGDRCESIFPHLVSVQTWAGGGVASIANPRGYEEFVLESLSSGNANNGKLTVLQTRRDGIFGHNFEFEFPLDSMIRGSLEKIIMLGEVEITDPSGEIQAVAATSTIDQPLPSHIFGGAVHKRGANQSAWRTDLVVSNPGASNIDYSIRFHEASTGLLTGTINRQLMHRETHTYEDFVLNEIGMTKGVGWIEITGNSPLIVQDRTYNDENGETLGGFLPQQQKTRASGQELTYIAVDHNDRFRSNLGLINSTNSGLTATVRLSLGHNTLLGEDQYILNPGEQKQINGIIPALVGEDASIVGGRLAVSFDRSGGAAYVSKIDNSTNDPLILHEQNPSIHFFIPAVVRGAGQLGSNWRTELRFQPLDMEVSTYIEIRLMSKGKMETRTIEYLPQGDIRILLPGGGVTSLPGGEEIVLNDAFSDLGFGGKGVGFLEVYSSQPLFAACRVYSEKGITQAGLGLPILPATEEHLLTSNQIGEIAGIKHTADFRGNLSIQNYGNQAAEVELILFNASGTPIGPRPRVLIEKRSIYQANNVVSSLFGLERLGSGRVRIKCLTGDMVGAYGSVTDNRSSDGYFLPLFVAK